MTPPKLLTIAEAAAALRVSRWSVYQLIRSRRLETIRIGSRRLVPEHAISQLVQESHDEEATR